MSPGPPNLRPAESPGTARAVASRAPPPPGGPAGLPYSAFLDARGSLIVNSKREGENIGYPAQPTEIDWFVEMMRKAAPKISDDDLKTIETALKTKKTT